MGFGYIGTVYVALTISILTLIQIAFFLPESLPIEKRITAEKIFYWAEINILCILYWDCYNLYWINASSIYSYKAILRWINKFRVCIIFNKCIYYEFWHI